jgi:NAD(P)-dependent dehydrogenase (short-subunit alcohol dehydrogenase family)
LPAGADVNVKVIGYLRCAREVAPVMQRQRSGRTINISGLAARQTGSIVGSIRNVSVAALTKYLADELGPHGVNVTCVHPGVTLSFFRPSLSLEPTAQLRIAFTARILWATRSRPVGRLSRLSAIACDNVQNLSHFRQ